MKKIITSLYTTFLLAVPVLVGAQFNGGDDELANFGNDIVEFITNILTPLVFGVALLLFIYGAFLYFIYDSEDDESRKKGREYMLWAFIALVLMVTVWGITNLIAGGLGFDDPEAIDGLIPVAGETT